MKKTKLLLPLVGFATVSTVVAPLVTLASCGSSEDKPEQKLAIECPDSVEVGQTIQCSVTGQDNVCWNIDKFSNGYATMSEKGELTGLKLGTIKVIATLIKDGATVCGVKEVSVVSPADTRIPTKLLVIENGILKGLAPEAYDYSVFDTLYIPKEVKYISAYAFSNGEESTLPESVKYLDYERNMHTFTAEEYAEQGLMCDVTFEQKGNCTGIGAYAFAGAHFVNVAIPMGVKAIEEGAFKNNKKLENCYFPRFLESIGEEAFSGEEKLTSVIFNEVKTGSYIRWIENEEGHATTITDVENWIQYPIVVDNPAHVSEYLGAPFFWQYGKLLEEQGSYINFVGKKAFFNCPNLVYHKGTNPAAYQTSSDWSVQDSERGVFSNDQSEEFEYGQTSLKTLDFSILSTKIDCEDPRLALGLDWVTQFGLVSPNSAFDPATDMSLFDKTIIIYDNQIGADSERSTYVNMLHAMFGLPQPVDLYKSLYAYDGNTNHPTYHIGSRTEAFFVPNGQGWDPRQKLQTVVLNTSTPEELEYKLEFKPFWTPDAGFETEDIVFPTDVEVSIVPESIQWEHDEGINLNVAMEMNKGKTTNNLIISWDKAPTQANNVTFEIIMKSETWGIEQRFGVNPDLHKHVVEVEGEDPITVDYSYNDPIQINFQI